MNETLFFADASYLSIQVYGLAIVISMLVAVVIRGVVSVLSAVKDKKADVTANPVVVSKDDGDHIAAIAAAIWAVAGPHRIVHIESAERGRVWVTEGRLTHHASHAVERRSRQWDPKAKQ
uniref:Oxaloacetate decarboxylase, gamma chain n=1 Tax=Candidatus Kentrum eta TaxID=2126337 RepID=A0A450UVE3_9GAMM|nr:MAG: hypothetical protein BECKH772A_GA0070896_100895 [Candidatus Kentron sp. H]VFJ96410.1 MAG: hypothetical protein BECKH772B_GA0070898_100915 [Candidatus Kentron sp. H]VFK02339.1 MAG: hypothetical protein BECKH772C_GA0070978_100885 [Candidatus Kentron sp. H]